MTLGLLICCFSFLARSCVADYQVKLVPSFMGTVLEEPHWDASLRSLFYVDIAGPNSSIQRYDYNENKVYKASIDNATLITYIIPIKCVENHFLVGMEHRSYIVEWNGRSPKATVKQSVFDVDCGGKFQSNVMNDFKTDPYGRIYGGMKSVESCESLSSSQATGSFYRYETGKCVKRLFGNVFISNGLTWIKNKFFYADSCAYDIKQFDYNRTTGAIAYERQIFSLISSGQKPDFIIDGITSDTEGNIYAATFGGSRILKIDSQTGKLLLIIKIPTSQVTSLAFGGPKMDILYVTTANKDRKQPKPAGHLFKVIGLNQSGFPGVKVKIYDSCETLRIKYAKCCPFS